MHFAAHSAFAGNGERPMRDSRIDAYIAKSAGFARPILEHVRELVHQTVPGAGEAIKWGMPHFTYKDKSIAGMAAFTAHCAVMVHGDGRQNTDGMGSYGKITSLKELPAGRSVGREVSRSRRADRGQGHGREAFAAPRAQARIGGAAGLRSGASRERQGAGQPSRHFRRRNGANTSNGSATPSRTRPARNGSPHRSNGSPKASAATGNTETR